MKKKLIFIIVAVAIVLIAIWLYYSNKNKATTTPVSSSGDLASNLKSAPVAAAPAQQSAVQTTPFNPPSATTPVAMSTQAAPMVGLKFTRVLEDKSAVKGSILRWDPADKSIQIGNSIIIPSGAYAGTFEVWYIYEGANSNEPTVRNLYIKHPYVGDTSGTFSKA